MESHFTVAIEPRMIPVSAREATEAASRLGEALQDVGAAKAAGSESDIQRAEDAYRVAKAAHEAEVRQDGWQARIGDTEFPVTDFAVSPDDSGAPVLSLVLSPGSIEIGERPAPAPTAAEAPRISSWDDGSQPDPRESIPGWQPEKVGGQVANHAERTMLQRNSAMPWLRLGGEGSAGVTA